jgi:hypothetical protein
MGDWIDIGNLKPTAQTLARGSEGIEDASANAPKTPDAGTSSEKVGNVLGKTFAAVAKLATVLAADADGVQANKATYLDADQGFADQLNGK